jgi:putative Ca2+/H+ antiporter (TMEM165/GDT1 family)
MRARYVINWAPETLASLRRPTVLLLTMNWPLFSSIFTVLFLAEFPDKTAFATMLMASKGKPLAVFTGVALAFLVQTIVGVAFGSVIALAPERWVHLGAGLVFFAFAGVAWRNRDEEVGHAEGEDSRGFLASAWKAFLVIFIAEWGDITQLATATFAAQNKSDVLTVFVASILALWGATAVTVMIGMRLRQFVSAAKLQRISAAAFAAVGAYLVISCFSS